MSALDLSHLVDRVKEALSQAEKKPFVVSVMGQTGVGKSTLINKLFNVELPAHPIRPTTKKAQPISVKGRSGHELVFYDLPGIGESEEIDRDYLTEYKRKLKESDVVIWAMHSDSRLFSYDLEALKKLQASTGELSMDNIMDKIIFVLTKADLLLPPPWILAKVGKDDSVFLPQEETDELLRQKEQYVRDNFILHYKGSLIAQTYHSGDFSVDDVRFEYKNNIVYYRGILSAEELNKLKNDYPSYQDTFERLYDYFRVVSCSALFRYNLDVLLRVVVSKIGLEAIARFSSLYTEKKMYLIPFEDAKEYSNIIVVDGDEGKIIFNLADINL